MGGYLKRFRGLTVYGKLENPKGHRIEAIFLADRTLRASETVKAAFLTSQGVPSHLGRDRVDLAIHAIQAMCDYLAHQDGAIEHDLGRFVAA